jgi:Response regulators consisting of a CheY-like receiver domain and a winged-helix DNA-binding domain
MGANILIVEDEEPLTTLLRYNLEAEGYDVDAVARGDEADTRLRETAPDLIVLDWMLPGLSGIELCRRLRARPQTQSLPIIMLTARGEESERVRGLATGADDYLVKPFSVPELLARIRALLRRASPERVATVLMIGDLELDREKKRVSRSNRPVDLGPTEFRLLEFLMERPAGCFRASSCSTESGAVTFISTNAPSTCMSAACARRSIAVTVLIRSAQCVAPAIRWTIASAKQVSARIRKGARPVRAEQRLSEKTILAKTVERLSTKTTAL